MELSEEDVMGAFFEGVNEEVLFTYMRPIHTPVV